jgi:pullulanase/glycogen debranching enzyme
VVNWLYGCAVHLTFFKAAHDMVRFQDRRNQANGEDNRDGHSNNHSANWGVEGESDNPQITAQRECIKRALLACTLLSQGTPMLAAGDEMGHSQGGNNNPYCQDNPLTWLRWNGAASVHHKNAADLLVYTQHLIQLRHRCQPWSSQWYAPAQTPTDDIHALHWLQADGTALSAEDWQNSGVQTLACWVVRPVDSCLTKATYIEVPDTQKPLLWLINGGPEAQVFQLSATVEGTTWSVLLDSSQARGVRACADVAWTDGVQVAGRSVVLLISAT